MSNSDTAVDVQNKFAFYLVALVFTVLALAVETAAFSMSKLADGFELFAWASLLISGLSGLRRLEMMSTIYSIAGKDYQGEKDRKIQGEALDNKQKFAYRWYLAHKWLFVAGLVFLIVSRGSVPLTNLILCNG
ncbi:hypothetical protein MNBD_GAMMA15-987 [hydrothermal vent metagenome]|uniref:Uncharacterized protein n=1 Tax=hydrothermal vent metagenome TaxID=652676 RepID=A0A3B0YUE6_9ZZZZ